MKKCGLALFLAAFTTFVTPPVMATSILNLTGLPAYTYDGEYVGPSTGNLNGGPTIWLYCDDFTGVATYPSSYEVSFSAIPSLQYAKFAQPGPPTSQQIDNYERVSILDYEMTLAANQNATTIGGIQFAIWDIMDPSAPSPAGASSWIAWVYAQNPANYDFTHVIVVTPVLASDQEFLIMTATPVPTPELETLVMMGFGLVTMGLFRRRKMAVATKR